MDLQILVDQPVDLPQLQESDLFELLPESEVRDELTTNREIINSTIAERFVTKHEYGFPIFVSR